MDYPPLTPACMFRTPPEGAVISSTRRDRVTDWYWWDPARSCRVYISSRWNSNTFTS